MTSFDRQLDNRWNLAVDALTQAWDRLGPDTTLAWVRALAGSERTAEGLPVVETGARLASREGGQDAATRDGEVA